MRFPRSGERTGELNRIRFLAPPDERWTLTTLEANLPEETYAHVRKEGIPFRMDLPVAPGRYQVHLAVRDNRNGALGTLVVPLVIDAPGVAKP